MSETNPQLKKLRLAFGSVPKDGGTFSFFRNHVKPLRALGIEATCVTVGRREAQLINRKFVDSDCVLIAENAHAIRDQAQQFVDWCIANEIDVVIPVNSLAIIAAIPHLPNDILVISRCANAFEEGYRFATAHHQHIAHFVALSPLIKSELCTRLGIADDLTTLVPNGVQSSRFHDRAPHRGDPGSRTITIAFLGRLEHRQKGVLHLPEIVRHIDSSGTQFILRIAGTGIDEDNLRARLSRYIEAGRVEFVGRLGPAEIPSFLGWADVLLFPSHFEGCPNVLLEGLAAGCCVVAWELKGITDHFLGYGRDGILIRENDEKAMGSAITELARDPLRLQRFQWRARESARTSFSVETCAAKYAEVIRQALETSTRRPPAWPFTAFDPPAYLLPRARWIPEWLRRVLRTVRSFMLRVRL